jgi:uncharacterized membrane protein YhaH (DUF805 family)
MLRDALRYNLSRLATFSGRESRDLFLPYAGAAFGLTQIAGMLGLLPTMSSAFARINRFAMEHPDQATVAVGPGSYSVTIHGDHPELIPDLTVFMFVVGASAAVFIVLVAAAVARRLHDCGRSGFWGLAPLPLLPSGFVIFSTMFNQFRTQTSPDMNLFFLGFANNGVYLLLWAC